MLKNFLLIAVVVASITGCATDAAWFKSVDESVAAGRCNDARNVVKANASSEELFYGVTGYVYLACDKDQSAARSHLNLAARLGNTGARKILAERGWPVPAADLQTAQGGDGLSTALGGYLAGRYGTPAPAAAPSTSPTLSQCDARRNTMGANIGMDQRYSVNCY